jgi:5-methylcytosine-specific restriction endonuclease McrA
MLHIVQGGIENGDKAWLERAAKRGLSHSWVNPKRTRPGDRAIIYIAGIGFFATATFKSEAIPSKNWANRYSSRMGNVRLIRPPVSLGVIRRKLPRFKWADYPRSITTPDSTMEAKLLRLVADRRRLGSADISEKQFVEASLAELRAAALLRAKSKLEPREKRSWDRRRAKAVAEYVPRRSAGTCEGCRQTAPFLRADGSGYLEPHHVTRVSDGGPDHPAHVIALCPNCHRRVHHGADGKKFNKGLMKRLKALEPSAQN